MASQYILKILRFIGLLLLSKPELFLFQLLLLLVNQGEIDEIDLIPSHHLINVELAVEVIMHAVQEILT